MKRHLPHAFGCAFVFLACHSADGGAPSRATEAKVGVFFGGQLQERREAPLELDPARQNLGLRLRFAQPQGAATQVRWEVDVPGSRATRGQRVVRLGRAHLDHGQVAFDQKIALSPGDPEGIYNFRCFLGPELLLDRALLLYDPIRRRRLLAEESDGDD